MTGADKVLDVEKQVREIAAGDRQNIECPYCGFSSNPSNRILCCDQLSTVVLAVLDHMEHIDRTEALERTMERLDKQQKMFLN